MSRADDFDRRSNWTRYRVGQSAGHYESFFQRANHPTRPLAFWIRYTLFSPEGRPRDAIGELWAIYFDGESGRHVAAKTELPLADCAFSADSFGVTIGDARLETGALSGSAGAGERTISWRLGFRGKESPLYLLPRRMYEARLPRAKSLVALPMARYAGTLTVEGRVVEIADWLGSQNHNWGSRHTDHYAWGQVAGFDSHPESFLEVATARLKIGPLWTPPMTPIVLRHRGREIAVNRLSQTLRARAAVRGFEWTFAAEDASDRIAGRIAAARDAFVGLRYFNPPGGIKQCLNSKLASCEITLTDKRSGASETLSTKHRAAFEILTDDSDHGVALTA